MKLLVVSSWFPYPPDNGSKLRAFNLLMRLGNRHAITLLSFAEPGAEIEGRGLTEVVRRVQTVPGNPFKPEGPLRPRDFVSRTPRSYAQTYSPEMQALVDAAVPHHEGAVAFQLGSALYLRHASLPRIFDEVETGVIRDQYLTAGPVVKRLRHGLTWWKYSRFLRQLIDCFELTTVVSDVERHHLRAIDCDLSHIRILPNGVDRAAFGQPNMPRPGRLIYPGSITYSANLEAVRFFVGEIFPTIRSVRPDASLVVTGATGGIDTAGLSAGGGVAFTGQVPNVARLVGHSAVCVVPLRIGGGTRIKILEAMALGTPVVATSKGAEGLTVTDGEDILIADSPGAFAAQVLRVMDDFVLRARLAANGRRLVERLYTWDQIGAQLEDMLTEAQAMRRERDMTRPKTSNAGAAAIA